MFILMYRLRLELCVSGSEQVSRVSWLVTLLIGWICLDTRNDETSNLKIINANQDQPLGF